jgi:magnesium transporter
MDEYNIHPLIAEELLLPSLKPRVEFYPDSVIYLILHFPASKHTHSIEQNQEIDFIIGKNFLITTRYDTIDPLHKFAKVFEVNSILDKHDIGEHAGYVFFYMVQKLYQAIEHELEYVGDSLEEIKEKIFKGHEREMVTELSKVSRELLNFKQALRLHKEVLDSFEVAAQKFFGDDFTRQARAIMGEYYRIQNSVASNLDTVTELRETNNSLITTKQNEIMKILTIMAFVTFPLSLFASIFGMNTKTLPLAGFEGDFWIILGIMVAATIFFFAFFKHKRWL